MLGKTSNSHYMQKIFIGSLCSLVGIFIVPNFVAAASQPKTFTGTVTQITGNQVFFRSSSAAAYRAELLPAAILVRRYGAPLQPMEILPGDRIEVKGTPWSDNSISATYFRDLSLYAHSGTFSAKIETIDPLHSAFTMLGRWGPQTVQTDGLTVFRKNGVDAALSQLTPGMSVAVKGTWERSNSIVAAKQVLATVRLLNVDFTGEIVMKNDLALTVVGDNQVIYGVDVSKAALQNKNAKPLPFSRYGYNDRVRVWGKHAAESVSVTATRVEDLSVSK